MQQASNGQKVRVTIVACDPSQRKIHGRFKDGGTTSIAVWEVPNLFSWPKVGEVWTVMRQNNFWILGSRLNNDSTETFPITMLVDDQGRVDSTELFDQNGNQFVAVMQSGIQTNYTLAWSGGWNVTPVTTITSGNLYVPNIPLLASGVYGQSYLGHPIRPVYLTANVTVASNSTHVPGIISLVIGPTTQPTTEIGRVGLATATVSTITTNGELSTILPAGWYYQFNLVATGVENAIRSIYLTPL